MALACRSKFGVRVSPTALAKARAEGAQQGGRHRIPRYRPARTHVRPRREHSGDRDRPALRFRRPLLAGRRIGGHIRASAFTKHHALPPFRDHRSERRRLFPANAPGRCGHCGCRLSSIAQHQGDRHTPRQGVRRADRQDVARQGSDRGRASAVAATSGRNRVRVREHHVACKSQRLWTRSRYGLHRLPTRPPAWVPARQGGPKRARHSVLLGLSRLP